MGSHFFNLCAFIFHKISTYGTGFLTIRKGIVGYFCDAQDIESDLRFSQFGAHVCLVDGDDFVKVEKNPQEVGDEKAGDDGDEDHGHFVLSLPPPVLDLLSLVRLVLAGWSWRALLLRPSFRFFSVDWTSVHAFSSR